MKNDSKYTILVVDDSTTNVVLLDAILSERGYEIITSLNAKEAFSVLKKEQVDLILLDLLMPKISGFDFLKEVKKNELTRDIPVIVVSAVTDKENVEKTKDLGAVDFIHKPIDIMEFIKKVETILT